MIKEKKGEKFWGAEIVSLIGEELKTLVPTGAEGWANRVN